jgi:hypothetical protein
VDELVERKLDTAAREYVASQLRLSGEMGKKLGSLFDPALAVAKLWSWLPRDEPLSVFAPYDDALPRDMPHQPAVAWAVEQLRRDGAPRVLIVEDDLASASDPFIWRADHPSRVMPAFFVEERVYWFADGDQDEDVVARVLHGASGYPGLGFIAQADPATVLPNREPADPVALKALVRRAEQLVVSAWDGDGWIVCELS